MRFLTLTLCLLATTLAACGGDDPGKGLPSSAASSLLAELGVVESRLDQGSVGACEDVLDESVPSIQKKIDSLPEATDPNLRSALEDSFTQLRTLSEQECDKRREAAEDKTTETETTPEPTTTTETTPPPTTTETTPPTTETTPKPEKNKGNQRKGNGDGGNDDSGGSGGSESGLVPDAGQGGGVGPGVVVPEGDG